MYCKTRQCQLHYQGQEFRLCSAYVKCVWDSPRIGRFLQPIGYEKMIWRILLVSCIVCHSLANENTNTVSSDSAECDSPEATGDEMPPPPPPPGPGPPPSSSGSDLAPTEPPSSDGSGSPPQETIQPTIYPGSGSSPSPSQRPTTKPSHSPSKQPPSKPSHPPPPPSSSGGAKHKDQYWCPARGCTSNADCGKCICHIRYGLCF